MTETENMIWTTDHLDYISTHEDAVRIDECCISLMPGSCFDSEPLPVAPGVFPYRTPAAIYRKSSGTLTIIDEDAEENPCACMEIAIAAVSNDPDLYDRRQLAAESCKDCPPDCEHDELYFRAKCHRDRYPLPQYCVRHKVITLVCAVCRSSVAAFRVAAGDAKEAQP